MDSMRTNDISQWENVYLSNKNTFASCNKRNLEVYRCIREEEYETLKNVQNIGLKTEVMRLLYISLLKKECFQTNCLWTV